VQSFRVLSLQRGVEMLGARFWKIARLLGGIAIIWGLAQFVRAKTPEPFLQVGAVQNSLLPMCFVRWYIGIKLSG
jgi:hypothetical protein